jgi:hypothetical protein
MHNSKFKMQKQINVAVAVFCILHFAFCIDAAPVQREGA